MEEKLKLKKRLRILLIVFCIILIPAYWRIIDTNGFDNIRPYVIVILLVTGICAGVIITTAKEFFRMKPDEKK